MTKNSGPKRAARKYQKEHPGTTFPEAMRATAQSPGGQRPANADAFRVFLGETIDPAYRNPVPYPDGYIPMTQKPWDVDPTVIPRTLDARGIEASFRADGTIELCDVVSEDEMIELNRRLSVQQKPGCFDEGVARISPRVFASKVREAASSVGMDDLAARIAELQLPEGTLERMMNLDRHRLESFRVTHHEAPDQ